MLPLCACTGGFGGPSAGRPADRLGGARVTMVDFFLRGLGVAAVDARTWTVFLLSATTGLGNGSTYRMIRRSTAPRR
jgi:NNP family nitrate/nitrite transporter-like MFS transporter